MFDVVLVEPRIPPNTGNVIRLCANTGARLHLVEPLGFTLGEPQLRRAGLDYHDLAEVRVHASLAGVRADLDEPTPRRWWATSARGGTRPDLAGLRPGDVLVFGPEPTGLAPAVLAQFELSLTLPMVPANRSLNLSNAVAVIVYEGWRQNGFTGSEL